MDKKQRKYQNVANRLKQSGNAFICTENGNKNTENNIKIGEHVMPGGEGMIDHFNILQIQNSRNDSFDQTTSQRTSHGHNSIEWLEEQGGEGGEEDISNGDSGHFPILD